MRHLISKIFFTACCAFVGCENRKNSEAIDSGWAVYKLDKFWLFNAPQGTRVIYEQGVDSTPGRIILATDDSVSLEFDSSFEMAIRDTICNLGSEAVRAKKQIARGDYKYLDKPDTIHQVKIDTVNGRIAKIITPLKKGGGTTRISILDCESGRWLGIDGVNIPPNKQELVLKIYRSIRQESVK